MNARHYSCQYFLRNGLAFQGRIFTRNKSDSLKIPVSSNKSGYHSIYTDGASRGNPGKAGCGAVIYNRDGHVIRKVYQYVGDMSSCNFAEYCGILLGLRECRRLGLSKVSVFMDSQLVCNHLSGVYRVKSTELLPLYHHVKSVSKSFEDITFSHIPREKNSVADSLANLAIDSQKLDISSSRDVMNVGDSEMWEELQGTTESKEKLMLQKNSIKEALKHHQKQIDILTQTLTSLQNDEGKCR